MHGYVNVFTASLLAHMYRLDQKAITDILIDDNPSNFSFAGDILSWRHLKIAAEEIQELHNSYLHSYGSCSFDEPRLEIKELGLIKEEIH